MISEKGRFLYPETDDRSKKCLMRFAYQAYMNSAIY